MNEQKNMAKLVGTFLRLSLTHERIVESGVHLCFTDLDVIGRLLRMSEYRFLKIVVHEVNCLTLAVLCILQSLLIHVNVDFSTFKLFDL
jgi:hypothetical protein